MNRKRDDPRPSGAPLPRSTFAVFGVAGIAIGTINTGLNFFLLVYYDQVVGLRPVLAGFALALSLVADGIVDPLVGMLSDRLRSRWGRRHPFLLVSILPMCLSYWVIWYPPFSAEQQWALFGYLLACAIALRASQTLFDVPTNALVPELTRDYEARTTLSICKVSLTWITSNLTGMLMYAIWLRDAGQPGAGLMNQRGYQDGATWFTFALLLVSSAVPWGLRRYIPELAAHPPVSRTPVREALRNLIQTYGNRSILALLTAAVFMAAASGLTNAIWVYLYSFYWACSSAQVNLVQGVYLFAAAVSLWLLPRLSRGRDKRDLGLRVSVLFWIFTALPYAFRSIGWFPAPHSPWRMVLLGVHAFVDGILFNILIALFFSLLADVVEDNLAKTGRREEGLILASQTFITKVSTAAGTWLAAALLTVIHFPRAAGVASPSSTVLFSMGLIYTLLMWVLGALSTIYLRRYQITRHTFEDLLRRVST